MTKRVPNYETSSLPTCEGCPLVNIIMSDMDALADISFTHSETEAMSEAVAGKMMNLMNICRKAVDVSCREQPKDLPLVPEPIPPLAHPDRIAYGRHCLAYLALRKEQDKS